MSFFQSSANSAFRLPSVFTHHFRLLSNNMYQVMIMTTANYWPGTKLEATDMSDNDIEDLLKDLDDATSDLDDIKTE
jgi:hypothetical protein